MATSFLVGGSSDYLDYRAEDGEQPQQVVVTMESIDRVSEWIENVSWIKEQIAAAYTKRFGKRSAWPAQFDVLPFALDFSDMQGFGNLPSLFRRDIFVLNYVVSEVYGLDELLPVMRKMVEGCAGGSHFLFIDRSDPETCKKVEVLIQALELHVECGAAIKDSMDTDEDKSVLKDISDFLGTQPRLTWDAVWVLATRPQQRGSGRAQP